MITTDLIFHNLHVVTSILKLSAIKINDLLSRDSIVQMKILNNLSLFNYLLCDQFYYQR